MNKVRKKLVRLERYLQRHARTLFKKQHRDSKHKNHFSLAGSFKVGTGSTQVGNQQHITKGRPGFVPHNFKNTTVYVKPVPEQGGPTHEQKKVYRKAMRILRLIDPEYAAGETLVQFAHMNSPNHYVDRHTDGHDISPQYAVSLGSYRGATLRCFDTSGGAHDVDNRFKIVRFDGRLPHEVVKAPTFEGDRFTVIWYKNYDARKAQPDPIVETPCVVWP